MKPSVLGHGYKMHLKLLLLLLHLFLCWCKMHTLLLLHYLIAHILYTWLLNAPHILLTLHILCRNASFSAGICILNINASSSDGAAWLKLCVQILYVDAPFFFFFPVQTWLAKVGFKIQTVFLSPIRAELNTYCKLQSMIRY